MKILGHLRDENLTEFLQAIQKAVISAISFVEGPCLDANTMRQRSANQFQADLLLGAKDHLVGDVVFFRRAVSLAQSSGR